MPPPPPPPPDSTPPPPPVITPPTPPVITPPPPPDPTPPPPPVITPPPPPPTRTIENPNKEFTKFLKDFSDANQGTAAILSAAASTFSKELTDDGKSVILTKNLELIENLEAFVRTVASSESSLREFQSIAVNQGVTYRGLQRGFENIKKSLDVFSKDSGALSDEMMSLLTSAGESVSTIMREISSETMEQANPLFKKLNDLDDAIELMVESFENATTFMKGGADNYRKVVETGLETMEDLKKKRSELITLLETTPDKLVELNAKKDQIIAELQSIVEGIRPELEQKEASKQAKQSEIGTLQTEIKRIEMDLSRLSQITNEEATIRQEMVQIQQDTTLSTEEKTLQTSLKQTELDSLATEVSQIADKGSTPQALQVMKQTKTTKEQELSTIISEIQSLTVEKSKKEEELSEVEIEIGGLPQTTEQLSALEKTVRLLTGSIENLEEGVTRSADSSLLVQQVSDALKPIDKTMEKMSFEIDYREAAYGEIDKMGWFVLGEQISVNKKEVELLGREEKLLRKQLLEIDKRTDMTEEERISAKKRTMETLQKVSAEKEKRVSRGEKLNERRKEGMFAKFFDGIKKSLDGLKKKLSDAASSWITKLIVGLIFFGFLLKRGLISPETIAKVISFIVVFLIEAVKTLIGLLFTAIGGVFDVIIELFKSGNWFAGIIVALTSALIGLYLLGKTIALVSGLWGGIVGGLKLLAGGVDLLKNAFTGITGFFKGGGATKAASGIGGGVTKAAGGLTQAAGGAIAAPGGGPKNSIFNMIGNALKSLGTTEALKGAAVMVMLGTSILLVAKAFEAFSNVSWGGVAKGFVSLTALVGLALFVKTIKNDILKGAAAIATLGFAMMTLGYGLKQFVDVGLGDIVKGLAALTALIFLARLVKESAVSVMIGAAAIAILGAALIPLAFGLSLLSGIGSGQIISFAIAVGILTGVAALAGMGFALIALGAGALAILGLSMLAFIPIIRSLSGIDASSLLGFATAVGILTGVAALAGMGIALITLGSAALLILGSGIAASIFLIGLAMKQMSGIDFSLIAPFSDGMYKLAGVAMWLAPFAPLIMLGSLALGALGLAMLPFAYAMSLLNGVVIDLQQIANLDEAIRILAWRAIKTALFSAAILIGSLALGALGLAVLPFAQAMNLLNGVVIDLNQIANLDEAIRILAWRAVKEAPFLAAILLGSYAMGAVAGAIGTFVPFIDFLVKTKFDTMQMLLFSYAVSILTATTAAAGLLLLPILLGSFALVVLGKALQSFIPIINSLRGIDGNAVLGLGLSIYRMVQAATYAGYNLFAIYLGADALEYLGKKLIPFASLFQYLYGLDAKLVQTFGFVVRSLVYTASYAGFFQKEITKGSEAMGMLGHSLRSFADVFNILSRVKPETILGFAAAVGFLTKVSLFAGFHYDNMVLGSSALAILGTSLTSFADRMIQISGIDPNTMMSFAMAVKELVSIAMFAGFMLPFMIMGSLSLALLGASLTSFGDTMNKIRGLKPEDADAFAYAIRKMLDLISQIGFFEGLGIVAKVSLIGDSLKAFGESLIPFSVAMQNMKDFEPTSLSKIAQGLSDLLREMLNLEFYGNPQVLYDFFSSITGLGPGIEYFANVIIKFSRSMGGMNNELFKFADIMGYLSQLPDPLHYLAMSLNELSYALIGMGEAVSSLSDEEFLRIIRLFSLTTRESSGMVGGTVGEGTRTSQFMTEGSARSIRSTRSWRGHMIAGQPTSPDKDLTEEQIAAIHMALSMSEKNAENYPSYVLDKYAKQTGINRGSLPRGTDFVPTSSSSTEVIGKESMVRVFGEESLPANMSIAMSPEGKTLTEIRTILMETKDIQAQNYEKGGNAVIMQNNNTNVANSGGSSSPVIRTVRATDSYFGRLRFRHQI